jgi:cobalt-zinc-cadmium efflux system protein
LAKVPWECPSIRAAAAKGLPIASTIATGLPVLTTHIVVNDDCFHDGHLTRMLDDLQGCLAGHFDVEHSTFQFEAAAHAEHEHPTHA